VDTDERVLGVVHDEWLAHAASSGQETVGRDGLGDDFVTTTPDRPLIDLMGELGRHAVPMAVVDEHRRLLGVVPRAAVLSALSAVPTRS
jgi:glycine betaine/proline transport system ATP-binding protein